MDRKKLLIEILYHLDEAMHLMEITEAKPDDEDQVWFAINEAHAVAEDHLNRILIANIQEAGQR